MFGFITRMIDRHKQDKAAIDKIVGSIVKKLNETREDNVDLIIPTKYYIGINNKLIEEHNLNLDYIRGNDNICEVNVCDYVDKRKIGDKIK